MIRVALAENIANKRVRLVSIDFIFMILKCVDNYLIKLIVKDKEIKSDFINFVVFTQVKTSSIMLSIKKV